MLHLRSITSSDAKATLGEVLGSLQTQGPIEITRNGHAVGVLIAPDAFTRATNHARLAALAALYSSGALSWRQVEDETGASFGELLLELGRQGLKLPITSAKKRSEQASLLDAALKPDGLQT